MAQETPEQFWQRVEDEIGEKPLYHTMARCRSGCLAGGSSPWGLFFVSSSAFHLWIFPRAGWFSQLISASTSLSSDSEEHFSVALDRVDIVERIHLPLFRRLFSGGGQNQIRISADGGKAVYIFEGLKRSFPEKVVPLLTRG